MIYPKSALPRLPDALCADVADPDATFFPGLNESHRAASALCRRCPERKPCLAWALDNSGVEGIWGNSTLGQRVRRRAVRRNLSS